MRSQLCFQRPREDEWLDVAPMKALPQETLHFWHRVGTALVPRHSPQSTACEVTHQARPDPSTFTSCLHIAHYSHGLKTSRYRSEH